MKFSLNEMVSRTEKQVWKALSLSSSMSSTYKIHTLCYAKTQVSKI